MTEKEVRPSDATNIRKRPSEPQFKPIVFEFPTNNIAAYQEKDSDNNSFLNRLSSEIHNDDDRLEYCGWNDLSRVIPGFGRRPKPRPVRGEA